MVVACFNSAFLHQPFSSLPPSNPQPFIQTTRTCTDSFFEAVSTLGNISELKLIAHSLAASKGNECGFVLPSLSRLMDLRYYQKTSNYLIRSVSAAVSSLMGFRKQ